MANEILTPALLWCQEANFPSGQLAVEAKAAAVTAALYRFAADVPYVVAKVVAGDGATAWDLSAKLGVDWHEGGGDAIDAIEYPFEAARVNLLPANSWRVYVDAVNGATLAFLTATPAATESVRVMWRTPYTEATVPARFVQAVAKLAGAAMARMMAARRAAAGEVTIGADAFAGIPTGDRFLALARDLEKQYEAEIGLDGGGEGDARLKAAGGTISYGELATGHGCGVLHRTDSGRPYDRIYPTEG